VWAATVGLAAATAMFAQCGRSSTPSGDTLPGRSRPLLAHGWKHPRDLAFQPGAFTPPSPGELAHTKSGVRALVLEDSRETLVRVSAVIPLGRLLERQGEAGASGYAAQLLANPDTWPAADAIALRLAAVGARPHVEQWLDATRVSVEVLAEDWREGLGILIGLLRALPADQSPLTFRSGTGYAPVTGGVEGAGFRPAVELQRLLVGYPLAPPDPGQALSRAAARALFARAVSPTATVVGVAGRVSRQEALGALEDATSGWTSTAEAPTPAALASRSAPAAMTTIEAPILEGWIAIGRVVGPIPANEQPALAVMADLLGTRLNIAAREKRGLANRDNFVLPAELDRGGLLHIRTGGRPEAVAPLVKVSLDEVRRLHAPGEPIGAEELDDAKGAVVRGKWQATLDGVRTASDTYLLELLRHGSVDRLRAWPDAVRAVTADQVKAAAQRYLDPAQMSTVVVGPLETIRAARHPRWPASLDELARR
jgi:zinc protease